jgi:YHS domain-containing protein
MLMILACLVTIQVRAEPPWSSIGEPVAIQGYDAVAYFLKSDAVRGNSKYFYEWSGMTWFFASPENRDLFLSSPDRYAPQFGGFCTVSVTAGKR